MGRVVLPEYKHPRDLASTSLQFPCIFECLKKSHQYPGTLARKDKNSIYIKIQSHILSLNTLDNYVTKATPRKAHLNGGKCKLPFITEQHGHWKILFYCWAINNCCNYSDHTYKSLWIWSMSKPSIFFLFTKYQAMPPKCLVERRSSYFPCLSISS